LSNGQILCVHYIWMFFKGSVNTVTVQSLLGCSSTTSSAQLTVRLRDLVRHFKTDRPYYPSSFGYPKTPCRVVERIDTDEEGIWLLRTKGCRGKGNDKVTSFFMLLALLLTSFTTKTWLRTTTKANNQKLSNRACWGGKRFNSRPKLVFFGLGRKKILFFSPGSI
jgi:hypothetical protein